MTLLSGFSQCQKAEPVQRVTVSIARRVARWDAAGGALNDDVVLDFREGNTSTGIASNADLSCSAYDAACSKSLLSEFRHQGLHA